MNSAKQPNVVCNHLDLSEVVISVKLFSLPAIITTQNSTLSGGPYATILRTCDAIQDSGRRANTRYVESVFFHTRVNNPAVTNDPELSRGIKTSVEQGAYLPISIEKVGVEVQGLPRVTTISGLQYKRYFIVYGADYDSVSRIGEYKRVVALVFARLNHCPRFAAIIGQANGAGP